MASVPAAQPVNKSVINDISRRAHNLARIVDRLSAGTYHLTIVKNAIHSADWNIEIQRSELIQKVSLSNKNYLSE